MAQDVPPKGSPSSAKVLLPRRAALLSSLGLVLAVQVVQQRTTAQRPGLDQALTHASAPRRPRTSVGCRSWARASIPAGS